MINYGRGGQPSHSGGVMKTTKTLYWILTVAVVALTSSTLGAWLGCSRTPAETTGVVVDAGVAEASASTAPSATSAAARLRQRFANAPKAPPPPPDTRTPQQLAQAACFGGKCKGSQVKPLLGAAANPIIPPSWTVPNWYIDPAKSVVCASDSNSGTSATCTGGCNGTVCTSGIGPMVTYQALSTQRWGTYSPRLQQATTLTQLSADSAGSDPKYLDPYIEDGGYLNYVCNVGATQTVGSGTIGSVSGGPSSRSGHALTSATFTIAGSPALAAGMLVKDTTNSAYTWLYTNTSGTTWRLFQPLAPTTTPVQYFIAPAEVAIASTDSVTLYTLMNADIRESLPHYTENTSNAGGAAVYVTHCNLWQPSSFSPAVRFGEGVALIESTHSRTIVYGDGGGAPLTGSTIDFFINDFFSGNLASAAPPNPTIGFESSAFIGGGTAGAGNGTNVSIVNSILDGDFTIGGNGSSGVFLSGETTIASLFMDNSSTPSVWVMGPVVATSAEFYGFGPIVWGNGSLPLSKMSRVVYPSGAGEAAATFIQQAGFTFGGLSKGCSLIPSQSATTLTCNLNATASEADSILGTTSGCLGAIDGPSVCNYGP